MFCRARPTWPDQPASASGSNTSATRYSPRPRQPANQRAADDVPPERDHGRPVTPNVASAHLRLRGRGRAVGAAATHRRPRRLPPLPARRAPRSPSSAATGSTLPVGREAGGWALVADERLDQLAGDLVVMLDRRRLHEVRGRPLQRPRDVAVEGQLGAAHRVDDHAGRVRRVPDFELQLDVERHVAERASLQPDVAPTCDRSATARSRSGRCGRSPARGRSRAAR